MSVLIPFERSSYRAMNEDLQRKWQISSYTSGLQVFEQFPSAEESSSWNLWRIMLQLFIVQASRRPWFQSLTMNNLQHLLSIERECEQVRIWG